MDVFPTLRFKDTPAGIKWLVEALGFEEHMVMPGEKEGQIAHAELKLGKGMIMVGDDSNNEDPIAQPAGSGATYIVVEDPDGHYQRACDHGAEVLRELADTEYGSREFTVRDPEGNVWSFGTYDPLNPPS